jgi:hypothetical protein
LLVLTCVFFSFQDSDRGGFSVRRFAGICNQPSAHMWRFASATVEKWAVPRGVSVKLSWNRGSTMYRSRRTY